MKNASQAHLIITVLLIVATLVMNSCGTKVYPSSNNIDPPESIITRFYSDEDLSNLLYGYYAGKYNNLRDLEGDYQVECIRDPRQYDERYMPYVVIMSESGKKAFLFFRPFEDTQKGAGDIVCCIVTGSFLSKDELLDVLYELQDNNATWTEWLPLLEKYECGMSSGAMNHQFILAVKEGVYGIVLSHDEAMVEKIQVIEFTSDYSLMHDAGHSRENGWDPWLILPVDKRENAVGG